MKHLRMTVCVAFAAMCMTQCSPSDRVRERGAKDIENAITVLESRKEAEARIITGHEREIAQLEENLDKVRTDGMRKKIRSDIEMKRIGIQRAISNMANQDTILSQLRFKLDSIQSIE